MKKIQFIINNNTLSICYKIEDNVIKNLTDTNIITKDDLIFDMKYFKNNLKLVAGFLNVMISNDHVTNAIVMDEELIELSLSFLNYLPSITELVIKPDVSIDFDMHLAILQNDTLKLISCYAIPTYLLERIDTTKSVKIVTRNEVFFVSKFLSTNRLTSYSDVFYKRKVVIDYQFGDIDYVDFNQFLMINMHLKMIYFEVVDLETVKKILKCLKANGKSGITMSIKGTEKNLECFNDLESYIKKNKFVKKNKIKFNIDYTKEYKLENFVKLLNFTSIKYILIVVIISCFLGYGLNEYDIYKSSSEIDSISGDIADLLEEYEYLNPPSDTEVEDPPAEPSDDTPYTPPTSTYVSPYYKNYAKVISVLKESNPDTVGWLTVNNTTVNYPVVQATNNSYYLNHDFNRNSNSLGWIYMDYRNNANELNQNTVIYGHNVSQGRIMFGDLSKVLNASWYNVPSNQYITFNTSSGDRQWRIFSIYAIAATNDYLYSKFDTQTEFLDFANNMKARSIHDFGVEIKENDKILTLSTCHSGGKNRLVVHAVLVQ